MKCSRLVVAIAFLAACPGSGTRTQPPKPDPSDGAVYQAEIRWTEYGIPHIKADDLGSLTFGQGYAFAKMHVCVLAEQIVNVRSQQARFFGPGKDDANITKDFGIHGLQLYERVKAQKSKVSDETRQVMSGYVAGYNKYLQDTGVDKLPEGCRGAEWVTPITDDDLFAYSMFISMIGSSAVFVDAIGSAKPQTGSKQSSLGHDAFPNIAELGLGSNAWAIGAERSENGHGMLIANPHFPWEGQLKFYESHLTIPGQLDVYGVTLMGLPLVSIAFNEHLAWSHTFSASRRFALYRLNLVEGDPKRYHYGDETRAMMGKRYTIQVRQPGGSLKEVARTLYRTHYGPMIGGGPLRWDAVAGTAYTLRDATVDNNNSIDQYLAMLRATTLDELKAAMDRYESTPFVNTIAVDKAGNTFYVDGSRVPNLSPGALAMWTLARKAIPVVRAAWDQGVIALDGSNPMFEFTSAKGAAGDGTVPFSAAPKLDRRDYVFNANDSYWIANLDAPITGVSPFYGNAESRLSPRSRMNLRVLTEKRDGGASGADGKFSAAELEAAILSDRSFTAELLRADVIARCKTECVEAAAILEKWDGTFNLRSPGAVLWREVASAIAQRERKSKDAFAEAFDPKRPLETPRGLGKNVGVAEVKAAMALLAKAGIRADASLGDVQFTRKGVTRIPVSGGGGVDGTTNQAGYRTMSTRLLSMKAGKRLSKVTGLRAAGYPINYGTSYLLVLSFAADGPHARAIVTYGASTDPLSLHFTDQMHMWSEKKLRAVRFRDAEIKADPTLVVETISAQR